MYTIILQILQFPSPKQPRNSGGPFYKNNYLTIGGIKMAVKTNTAYDIMQNDGVRAIYVRTEACDSADTTTVDLTTYGCLYVAGTIGFVETTANSVVVQEQPTTSVTTGTLTITVGGSTDNKKRTYLVGLTY
jgi:hypothetical protein